MVYKRTGSTGTGFEMKIRPAMISRCYLASFAKVGRSVLSTMLSRDVPRTKYTMAPPVILELWVGASIINITYVVESLY